MKNFLAITSLFLFITASVPAAAQNCKHFDKLPQKIKQEVSETQEKLQNENNTPQVALTDAAVTVLKEKESLLNKIETEELLIANGMIAHLERMSYSNEKMQRLSDIQAKKERIEQKINSIEKEIKALEKFLNNNDTQEAAVYEKNEEEKEAFIKETAKKINELSPIQL